MIENMLPAGIASVAPIEGYFYKCYKTVHENVVYCNLKNNISKQPQLSPNNTKKWCGGGLGHWRTVSVLDRTLVSGRTLVG